MCRFVLMSSFFFGFVLSRSKFVSHCLVLNSACDLCVLL